ncbi:hypothetical protein ES703_113337 [subsurface metagenome]
MNSLRMSFWVLPASLCGVTPCFWATAIYMASITWAGALIAIAGVTLSRGMPSKSAPISLREGQAMPTFPTSP